MDNFSDLSIQELKKEILITIRKNQFRKDYFKNKDFTNFFFKKYRKETQKITERRTIKFYSSIIELIDFSVYFLFFAMFLMMIFLNFIIILQWLYSKEIAGLIANIGTPLLFLIILLSPYPSRRKHYIKFNLRRWFTFYFIIFILIILLFLLTATIIINFYIYLILFVIIIILITIHLFFSSIRTMYGAGYMHMAAIVVLVDLDFPKLFSNYIVGDIRDFLLGWDDMLSETFNLRIENYDEIRQKFYQRIIFNPNQLKIKLREFFNQNFFELLFNHKDINNIYKISKKIESFFDLEIKFQEKSLSLIIKRKYGLLNVSYYILGIISIIIGIIQLF